MRKIETILRTIALSAAAAVMFAALICFTGCDDDDLNSSIVGSGILTTEERGLEAFHSFVSEVGADIDFSHSSEQAFSITTDDNLHAIITTEIRDGVLIISASESFQSDSRIRIVMAMTELRSIEIKGAGNINGGGSAFTGDDLKLAISGAGSITNFDADYQNIDAGIAGSGDLDFQGAAEEFAIEIAGSGSITAEDVQTQRCTIEIAGSGDCRVYVVETLGVTIAGSGSVFYKGDPEVSTSITGSGEVVKL